MSRFTVAAPTPRLAVLRDGIVVHGNDGVLGVGDLRCRRQGPHASGSSSLLSHSSPFFLPFSGGGRVWGKTPRAAADSGEKGVRHDLYMGVLGFLGRLSKAETLGVCAMATRRSSEYPDVVAGGAMGEAGAPWRAAAQPHGWRHERKGKVGKRGPAVIETE